MIIGTSRNNHFYAFRFTDATRQQTMRHIGELASNPQHPLTWYDAAILSAQMRKIPKAAANQERFQLPQVKP